MTYAEFIQNILDTRGRFIDNYDGVKERHHIMMKSLGGANDENNLIDLIGSEHYEAHKLLALENPNCREAQIAWWMMSHNADANGREYEVSAEDWESARLAWVRSFSGKNNPNFGKPMSDEQKAKISQTRKERGLSAGENNYFYGKRFCGEQNYWYGKEFPPEMRKKMSDAKKEYFKTHDGINKGKHMSAKSKAKLSNSLKGKMAGGKHRLAIPVVCEGVVYEYIGACADHYGVKRKTMQRWLKENAIPQKWRDLGLAYYKKDNVPAE